jgi:hypothetical protein
MAAAAPLGTLFEGDDTLEPHRRPGYRKLGFWNGLFIGLALALGSWGLEAWRLTNIPSPQGSISVLLSGLIVVVVCTFTGWLTARLAWGWLTVLLWFGVGVLAALFIGYQPYIGRTLGVWLADSRFWGIDVFPFTTGSPLGLILGGLVVILVLTLFGILQSYRLEAAVGEVKANGRLSTRAWLILLIPFPFVFAAAFATSSMQVNPAATAAAVVYDGIEVARAYDGDLFQLGLERGSNYAALQSVRELLDGSYTLKVGEIDTDSSMAFVLAEFEDGAWINCRVQNDQLSFCFDATPLYEIGLSSLITGVSPDDCPTCIPRVTDETQQWLRARAEQLGPQPHIERLAQWGGYVLLRATAVDGSFAVNCWFDKMSPLTLDRCEEVQP